MLFVVLPSASLDNSRYCDLDRFVEVVTNPLFRLELVQKKRSSKLTLLAFRRTTRTRTRTRSSTKQDADKMNQEQSKSSNSTPKKKKKKKTNHPSSAAAVRDNSRLQSQSHNYYYDVSKKTFDFGQHEMKRLQPAKPGAKRNNFAVILKSSHNRTGSSTSTQTNATANAPPTRLG